MSFTICLAPAQTIEYSQGGGHLWVYLNWARALRAAGCRVIWLEGVDLSERANARRQRPRHQRAPFGPISCRESMRGR